MKKYLLILAFSCLTLCSCDNFLDLTPQSVLTPENAYEKPEDWQQTLYAAYGTLQEVFVGKYTITLTAVSYTHLYQIPAINENHSSGSSYSLL